MIWVTTSGQDPDVIAAQVLMVSVCSYVMISTLATSSHQLNARYTTNRR